MIFHRSDVWRRFRIREPHITQSTSFEGVEKFYEFFVKLPTISLVNTITLYDSFAPLIGESAMELNARWQQASVFWVRKTICGVYG